MILCRTCRRASVNTAQFCDGCGRSFGFRFCPRNHRSSADSLFCSVCGSDELSIVTERISFGLPLRILTLLTALGLLMLVVASLPALGVVGSSAIDWAFQSPVGEAVNRAVQKLLLFLAAWTAGWIVLRRVFGRRSSIARGYTSLSRRAVRSATTGLAVLATALRRGLFERGSRR